MAVDALSLVFGADGHVVVYLSLVEVGDVALVDAQFLVCDIRWLYDTVGDV